LSVHRGGPLLSSACQRTDRSADKDRRPTRGDHLTLVWRTCRQELGVASVWRGWRGFARRRAGSIGANVPKVDAVAATNLVAPLAPLVGRSEELKSVADLLSRSRLVTLVGAGGCGKSRLAIEA